MGVSAGPGSGSAMLPIDPMVWKRKAAIAEDVSRFLGAEYTEEGLALPKGTPTPEIWAYYGAYDWVAFCQLWGTMMQLPKGFPMYVRDLKQECDRIGLKSSDLPDPVEGESEHNALGDARWTKRAWEFVQSLG